MLFQSIGKSGRALFLASVQSGLAYIPLLSVLPHFIGITGIQIAQPIAYFVSASITLPFVYAFFKSLNKNDIQS